MKMMPMNQKMALNVNLITPKVRLKIVLMIDSILLLVTDG